MGVYQVDEYYIYIIFPAGVSADKIGEVKKYLDDGGFDHSTFNDSVTIDGFDCGNEAVLVEQKIHDILNS